MSESLIMLPSMMMENLSASEVWMAAPHMELKK